MAVRTLSADAAVSRPVVFSGVKRLLVGVGATYLLFAVIGRFVEGIGAVECGCAADCWCKRPGLSVFRWVFPYGHRSSDPGGGTTANLA
jgi:hypothetical protein